MQRFYFLLIFTTLSLASCKNFSESAPAESEIAVSATQNKYTLTPFGTSPAFEDATIKDYKYEGGKFNFSVSEGDYKLGAQTTDAATKMCANSAKGQHIHLIVNNQPYAAKYTADFDYDIEDGDHYLLAFLSRSYHESIKTDNAHVAQKVSVKDKKITDQKDLDYPMIFYSRPKGTYVGDDTKKVMLDFYPINVALGEGHKVEANINGEKHILDTWQPYYIDGMPMGENTIELTLVDGHGHKINAPHNPVSRTFTLKADPAPEG